MKTLANLQPTSLKLILADVIAIEQRSGCVQLASLKAPLLRPPQTENPFACHKANHLSKP